MAPYMGVISIERIENTKNVDLVNQVAYSPYFIRVNLREASYDMEAKKVIKGALISSFSLTESQFGDLVSLAGVGSGSVSTLNHMRGYSIVDNNIDPVQLNLNNLINQFLEEDPNIKHGFETKIAELEETISKKRISAKEKKRFLITTRSLKMNLSLNSEYRFNSIDEETTDRVNQIKLELNSAISMVNNSKVDSNLDNLLIDDTNPELKNTNKASLALLSFSGSGGGELFNENEKSSTRVVSLSLFSTKDELSTSKTSGISTFEESTPLFKITFSHTHTANFLRCDGSDIQCTINRLDNKGCGSVRLEHTSVASKGRNHGHTISLDKSTVNSLYERLNALDEIIENTKPTNITCLKDALDELKSIRAAYSDLSKSEFKKREELVAGHISKQKAELSRFFEDEVNSLPLKERDEVQEKLSPFLHQHRLISK